MLKFTIFPFGSATENQKNLDINFAMR